MDRRTFLMTGAWLSTTGSAWPWMARAASAPSTVAVVDASLVDARTFSVDAGRGAMPVFETGDDIGMLWYTTLAPRLAATPGLLVGVTRASDHFVLEQLALRSGRMVEHSRHQYARGSAAIAFLMGPRES
jgi:hypothetical protein